MNGDHLESNRPGVSSGVGDRGNPAIVFDPSPGPRRNPADHLDNAIMVPHQVARENRFVMSDSVAQRPQGVQRPVGPFAGQCRAVRECPAQRRSPKRHLIVRLAPRADAASRTQQRDPEPERKGRHDPRWIVAMPVAPAPFWRWRSAPSRPCRGPHPGCRTMLRRSVPQARGASHCAEPPPAPATGRRTRRSPRYSTHRA